MNNSEDIKKKMYQILTIDGQGRSKKAALLLELIDNSNIENLKEILKEFRKLKY